jgi:hypothetical protein
MQNPGDDVAACPYPVSSVWSALEELFMFVRVQVECAAMVLNSEVLVVGSLLSMGPDSGLLPLIQSERT